jgi:putative MATE family efflux protein
LTDAAVPAAAATPALSQAAAARSKRPRYDRSIVEGPLLPAVWKLAWPTMLTNIVGGLQGMVDQALVGNLIGYKANAAIGVSMQMWLIVMIFISSLFSGMSVLVARFAGAGDHEKVDRTVYQAFITAIGMAVLIMAPIGYFAAPYLLNFVNAAPEVQREALPFLRIMFVFSGGMLVFFMLGGALRSAGDARTPMILGISLTLLNLVLNIILIRGLGPIPAFGTKGAAMGTCIASGSLAIYSLFKLWHGGWIVSFPRGRGYGPDWAIIRELFRFGLPSGFQGIVANIGGVFMLSFIGSLTLSAASQASVGLMGASAAIAGQNLGAGKPDRASAAVHVAARIGLSSAAIVGALFLLIPRKLLAIFGMHDPIVVGIGVQLLHVLSLSGLFVTVALTYTGGLQGTGDTKSPLYISIVSQVVVPLGICYVIQRAGTLHPIHIWIAILVGHATRCALSVLRFNQGKWRGIAVNIGDPAAPETSS